MGPKSHAMPTKDSLSPILEDTYSLGNMLLIRDKITTFTDEEPTPYIILLIIAPPKNKNLLYFK